ncbi:MAG: T9SS type A sorting domain-containing protein [Saprospiraceae bacterium]
MLLPRPISLLTLVVLLVSLSFQSSFAQFPDSIAGTPEFMGYSSVPILCNQTPYFGTTTWSDPSSVPTGFCASVENDQFICFQTANVTSVSFEFSLISCAAGGSGIEVGAVDLNGNTVGNCVTVDDPVMSEQLELTGLMPITTYCLRVDGVQGSNCDFNFTALQGVTADAPRQPNTPSGSTPPYCFGDTVGVSIERIPNASTYQWGVSTASGLGDPHYLGANGSWITTPVQDSIIGLVLPPFDITRSPGSCDTVYSFVTAINGCGESAPSSELAMILCTRTVDTLVFSTCGSDSLGVEYPVGSGNYYFDNGGDYQMARAPSGVCGDVIAILIETNNGVAAYLEIDTTTCSFPIILEGDTIVSEGIYEYYFPIASSGCDSIVAYTVRSPSAQGAALNNPYCVGDPVRVGNSPWDEDFTYTWTDGQGNLVGQTPNDYLNQFDAPGDYILTVSYLGCVHEIIVIVQPAPSLGLTLTGDLLEVRAEGSADSVALFINGFFEVGDDVQIFYQGLSNLGDSVAIFACAYAECGRVCEQVILDTILSNGQSLSIAELLVWPNPSSGIFNLQLEESVDGIVEVYNLIGERVLVQELGADAEIDLTARPAGVYLVVLKEGSTGLPIARRQVVKH